MRRLEKKKGGESESRRRKKEQKGREGRGASAIYRRPVLTRSSERFRKKHFLWVFPSCKLSSSWFLFLINVVFLFCVSLRVVSLRVPTLEWLIWLMSTGSLSFVSDTAISYIVIFLSISIGIPKDFVIL